MRHRFALECAALGLFQRLQAQWGGYHSNNDESDEHTELGRAQAAIVGGWSAQLLYASQLHVWCNTHGHEEGGEHVLIVQRRPKVQRVWDGFVGASDAMGAVCVDAIALYVPFAHPIRVHA